MSEPVDSTTLQKRVAELGPWFHNLDLHGVQTAPEHFLGDWPAAGWRRFAHAVPADLTGKSVLDIGCNGGFYALEMKRRGAETVVGIDSDPRYVAQARFAADTLDLAIEVLEMSVYDVARLGRRFDLVIFMGVLYHLRHPLLALDLIHAHVAGDLLLFQSMQRGDAVIAGAPPDHAFEERAVFDHPGFPRLQFIEGSYAGDPTNWWLPNRACAEAMLRSAGFCDHPSSRSRDLSLPPPARDRRAGWRVCRLPCPRDTGALIEAVMIWNEPNNKSHWAFEVDPDWQAFADMVILAGQAVAAEHPGLTRVLGGMSPIDPTFVRNLAGKGALDHLDAVAVHGFPLDWNHWQLKEWPDRLAEIAAVTDLPVWISEVGVSTFGAEEVQVFGLKRTAELVVGRAPRIHWYSLYDLPRAWPATTRHKEAEGSSYYRHFYMGLLREDGSAKPALETFADLTPELGICQWFHYEDHRLDDAVRRLKELGVRHLRTGLSWSDWSRPGALAWFDRQMQALEPFDVTLTFCFTPEDQGIIPHYTSPPKDPQVFAEFCAAMVRRYAPGSTPVSPQTPAAASA